jgi:hypothetical protein
MGDYKRLGGDLQVPGATEWQDVCMVNFYIDVISFLND